MKFLVLILTFLMLLPFSVLGDTITYCPTDNQDNYVWLFLLSLFILLLFLGLMFRQGFIGLFNGLFGLVLGIRFMPCNHIIGLFLVVIGLLTIVLFAYFFPMMIKHKN
jgi:hypothetical protein